jgi:hypothetical protein
MFKLCIENKPVNELDARTEKDVKNEGRTDYVYESTGSSDKKYFGKAAFCMPFGARPPASLGDIS